MMPRQRRGESIPSSVRAQLDRAGFALLRDFAPELESAVAFRLLGEVDSLEGFASVQYLTPKIEEGSTPNTYSGNFGIADFPLHTDLAHWAVPPRYLALRCVIGSKGVTTRVLDGKLIENSIGRHRLLRTLVQPRRRLAGGKHLLRLLDMVPAEGTERMRWDPLFLRPANDVAAEVLNEVRNALMVIVPEEVNLYAPGDTLLIDNYRMLHGRSPVPPHSVRVIARAYLETVSL